MAPPLRQLAADFLAEQDECVGAEAFERIASAITRLLQHIDAQGVTEAARLELSHVEGFLAASAAPDAADNWHATRLFVTWLGRRGYAASLSAAFKAGEKGIRRKLSR